MVNRTSRSIYLYIDANQGGNKVTLSIRERGFAVAVALIVGLMVTPATVAHAQPGSTANPQDRPSATNSTLPSLETRVAQTLQRNPGSRRVGKNAILLRPGIMTWLPSDGKVRRGRVASAQQCAPGWACVWFDAGYSGAVLGFRGYINLRHWHWDPRSGVGHCPGCTTPGLYTFSSRVSAIVNNTGRLAAFYNEVYRENLYVGSGEWLPYVGNRHNDRLTEACACG